MPRHLLTLLLLAVASLTLASCSKGPPQTIEVTAKDKGATLVLARDRSLEITLPANRTTGYAWTLVSDGKPTLEPQLPSVYTPQGEMPGAGGVERFVFKALQPGTALIKMIYQRPFEPEAAPAQTFEVKVSVTP